MIFVVWESEYPEEGCVEVVRADSTCAAIGLVSERLGCDPDKLSASQATACLALPVIVGEVLDQWEQLPNDLLGDPSMLGLGAAIEELRSASEDDK